MASVQVLAKRYAKALRLMFANQEEASKNLEAFSVFANAVNTSNELKDLLSSGAFNPQEKSKVVHALVTEFKLTEDLSRFISKVVELGRGEIIPDIYKVFATTLRAEQGLVELKVESALELSAEQENKLKTELEKATGKKFLMTSVVNPQLLAGIKVQMMGKTLDGSLRTLLGSMKEGLMREEARA